MRDSDIRQALHALLLTRHGNDPDTLIRHELGLCAGARRIDIALINGQISGYEIKSDEDTLNRLAGQAEAYARVLDRAFIVTTKRHLNNALNILPLWWGVMVAKETGGTIIFDLIRDATVNRYHDAFSLAQLLWRDEALSELRLRSKGRGLSNKARYYAWMALSQTLTLEELRSIVRNRLKARPVWPGGQQREPYDVKSQAATM